MLAIFALTFGLWLGSNWTGWDLTGIALLALVLCFVPGIEVLTWDEFVDSVSWNVILLIGSVQALAGGIRQQGSASWFLQASIGKLAVGAGLLVVATAVVVPLIRLFIPVGPALIGTTLLPLCMIGDAFGIASGFFYGASMFFNGYRKDADTTARGVWNFIFAVIGEELGLIGACLVLLLLMIIVIRCIQVGLRSGSTMSMLVCFGVTATVVFQTFENVGMCIGIAPVVGITLPFFSYGGSSLFSMFAAMGLVSGIKYRPKPARASHIWQIVEIKLNF